MLFAYNNIQQNGISGKNNKKMCNMTKKKEAEGFLYRVRGFS